MADQRGIRLYVFSVGCLAAAALVLCAAYYGNTLDNSRAGYSAIVAFAILAWLTGAIESAAAEGISGSVVFVAHLAAVVIAGPLGAAAVAGVAMLAAQLWLRRERIKVVFNVAQIVLSTIAGGVLYLHSGGHLRPVTLLNQDFVAYGVLVVAYFAINSTAVSGAVAISQGKPFGGVWRNQVLRAAGYDLIASALGLLVAWMYLRFGFWSVFVVTVPILALRQAYKENVELKRLNAELLARHRELLDYTVKQIEARDPYTSGHSRRVAQYAQVIAKEAGLSLPEVEEVATAALLHDVGKVYHEFGSVLVKEGRLTPEEKKLLQSHPVRSAELISEISNLRGGVELSVRHHHENFDGSGYPDGLAGNSIPIGSRIILLADTLDAMTTDRPYRKAVPFDRVIEEIRTYSGRQFDPRLVEIVLSSSVIRRMVGAASRGGVGGAVPSLASERQTPAWAARARV